MDEKKSRHRVHSTSSKSSVNTNNLGSGTSNVKTSKKHSFSFPQFSLRRFISSTLVSRNVSSAQRSRIEQSAKDLHEIDKSSNHQCPSTSNPLNLSFNTQASSSSSRTTYECPLCLLEQPISSFPPLLTCPHRACVDCLQHYLRIEISESRVSITCPMCSELLHPNDIVTILKDEAYIAKYESFMLRRVLVTEPDARWCPAPDCGFVVIASGCASCPRLVCPRPGCETSFCYHCKATWHPNQTCDSARAQRSWRRSSDGAPVISISRADSPDGLGNISKDELKYCPLCKVVIIKIDDGSCNHMTCSVCGTEFCWLCMKKISDLHFLSPSGCTFWGKKPWSQKKKILWQLGMLIGAPVGIALIAGIAVPAIVIGIPVYIGRKLNSRCTRLLMSKHKKNILVTAGVMTSVVISPILAAVTVGIGVPMMLAYVYGVVPISLCRSGGCSVETSSTGYRSNMDDESSVMGGAGISNALPAAAASSNVDVESCTVTFVVKGSENEQPPSACLNAGSSTSDKCCSVPSPINDIKENSCVVSRIDLDNLGLNQESTSDKTAESHGLFEQQMQTVNNQQQQQQTQQTGIAEIIG